jgi:type 1 glutamine amidotransferase
MRWFLAILLMFWSSVAVAAEPIKVMLLDGASAAAYHDWKLTTRIMKRELEETGLFDVTVVSVPPADGDFSNVHPDFAKYRVVVLNYDSQDWPAPLKAAFESYMKNGGGLVVVHGADNAFPDWVAFNEMTGVGGWRNRDGVSGPKWYFQNGGLTSDSAPGPAGLHGKRKPFRITARAPEHPILRGLPKEWMHAADELYTRLRGPGKNMTVLATAYADPANRGTGFDEPMLMALHWGKGRIFHTTLGHDAAALSCVGFAVTFQRGAEWAATGRVTQKLPKTFPSADTVSYRPDLAAMDPMVADGATTTLPTAK